LGLTKFYKMNPVLRAPSLVEDMKYIPK
jgi:hypothetical protein